MFRLLLALLLLAAPATANTLAGTVSRVSDGDTLTVALASGTQVKVRLYGIDAPEKRQPWGDQARAYARLWLGARVVVYSTGVDRYKRVLGWVCHGQRCLNRELVQWGHAWWYRKYAPRETNLAALETEARNARRGLWAYAAPVAPWAWRKGSA